MRYAETDGQAVVYHANYLIYFEVGRGDYVRALEYQFPERTSDGAWELILAHAEADFVGSAHFDDVLEVWTRCAHVGRTSFTLEYLVRRERDGAQLCRGKTVQVTIDAQSRRPVPLPAELSDKMRRYDSLA